MKEQKGGFSSKLLGTLSASLLVNILADQDAIGAGKCILVQGRILRLPHPVTNFEIQKHY